MSNQVWRGTFSPWGKTGPTGHQPSISKSQPNSLQRDLWYFCVSFFVTCLLFSCLFFLLLSVLLMWSHWSPDFFVSVMLWVLEIWKGLFNPQTFFTIHSLILFVLQQVPQIWEDDFYLLQVLIIHSVPAFCHNVHLSRLSWELTVLPPRLQEIHARDSRTAFWLPHSQHWATLKGLP